jgi:hypothetical protein
VCRYYLWLLCGSLLFHRSRLHFYNGLHFYRGRLFHHRDGFLFHGRCAVTVDDLLALDWEDHFP